MLTFDEYKRRNQQIINQIDGLKRRKMELKKLQLSLQKEKDDQKSAEIDKNLVKLK